MVRFPLLTVERFLLVCGRDKCIIAEKTTMVSFMHILCTESPSLLFMETKRNYLLCYNFLICFLTYFFLKRGVTLEFCKTSKP